MPCEVSIIVWAWKSFTGDGKRGCPIAPLKQLVASIAPRHLEDKPYATRLALYWSVVATLYRVLPGLHPCRAQVLPGVRPARVLPGARPARVSPGPRNPLVFDLLDCCLDRLTPGKACRGLGLPGPWPAGALACRGLGLPASATFVL